MGYVSPLLELRTGKALLELPAEQRAPLKALMRAQADAEAERSWRKGKGGGAPRHRRGA